MHWIDPDGLPELSGLVERWLLNPHGEADGFLFKGGQEVHFPPHMSEDVVAAVEASPKASIRVRGVRVRGAPLFAAVAFETADGKIIEDAGPHGREDEPHARPKPHRAKAAIEGVVARWLHGPKGERRGVLLQDGTIVRFPPHQAEAIADLLTPGAPLIVEGKSLTTRLGTVIEAHELGNSANSMRSLDDKKQHKKPKGRPKNADQGAHL